MKCCLACQQAFTLNGCRQRIMQHCRYMLSKAYYYMYACIFITHTMLQVMCVTSVLTCHQADVVHETRPCVWVGISATRLSDGWAVVVDIYIYIYVYIYISIYILTYISMYILIYIYIYINIYIWISIYIYINIY